MLILSAISACGNDQDPIVVSVASSQTDVFETIAPAVEASVGGRPIDLNFGGSTTLINQVNTGAPVDIIIVADQIAADAVETTVDDQVVVADNHLVAIAAPDIMVDELADLDDELIVVACDPSVP
ncbi:MAG: solute-binding protein, partial [Acidimicrobiales bacterium]|nr:solute-binding protein [Acidimicrobiales bacterium]